MTLHEAIAEESRKRKSEAADYLECVFSEESRKLAMSELGGSMAQIDALHDLMTAIGEHELASDLLSLRSDITHAQWAIRDKAI